jgi:hypothetical protein
MVSKISTARITGLTDGNRHIFQNEYREGITVKVILELRVPF